MVWSQKVVTCQVDMAVNVGTESQKGPWPFRGPTYLSGPAQTALEFALNALHGWSNEGDGLILTLMVWDSTGREAYYSDHPSKSAYLRFVLCYQHQDQPRGFLPRRLWYLLSQRQKAEKASQKRHTIIRHAITVCHSTVRRFKEGISMTRRRQSIR